MGVYINPMEEIYYFASPVHVLFPNNILTIKQKQKQKQKNKKS